MPNTDIILTTLNAKYIHSAFGLRYLLANMGELESRTMLVEFDINQRPLDMVEHVLAMSPKIVGFGVYIWNTVETLEVVSALRKLRPEVTIVLGGPEVSYETETQEIVGLADYVITGEADLAFGELCRKLIEGDKPGTKIIAAPVPDLASVRLPYELYSDKDIAHRILYVEASRGCPFTCEFCLSSLDIPVRSSAIDPFLVEMEKLFKRGARKFKFVDRTFNLNLNTSRAILEFFLERYEPGLFVHFEMVPDRLPEALREIISRFPAGALQFEVGIQTFNEQVAKLISRRQNYAKLEDNFKYLRAHTGVHIHADLIAGLPGETVGSFAAGFDRLVGLAPQEIQMGILKRLRGTPIIRHDQEFRMIYSGQPPYEILENSTIDFASMQRLRRFAKYWDLVGNSGNFSKTVPFIWTKATGEMESPFHAFAAFSERVYARTGKNYGISLARLVEIIFEYLTEEKGHSATTVADQMWQDYQAGGRSDRPKCLRPYLFPDIKKTSHDRKAIPTAPRQSRHLAGL
ncbi:MAG: DUF4080 domain-containing protein [Verrucomicrobiota bacterium]|nr:DUF4080 domain-containing protein [Verrucomicrobiota bacterium]